MPFELMEFTIIKFFICLVFKLKYTLKHYFAILFLENYFQLYTFNGILVVTWNSNKYNVVAIISDNNPKHCWKNNCAAFIYYCVAKHWLFVWQQNLCWINLKHSCICNNVYFHQVFSARKQQKTCRLFLWQATCPPVYNSLCSFTLFYFIAKRQAVNTNFL